MKKFTCLLLIAMAITYTLSATCTPAVGTHSFIARIGAIDSTAVIATTANEVPGTTTMCGTTAVLCCDATKMSTIVFNQITKIKTSFTTFGGKIAGIGANMAKIGALVNASLIGTTTPSATLGATATGDLSGATAAQFQAFGNYTPTAYVADYTAFAAALPDCFTKYSELIQKVACDGCANGAIPARYTFATTTTNSIWLKQAAMTAIAEKCTKVWNFMWKTGWFVQTVAYLNSKKATGYSYSAPAITAIFYQSGLTTGTAPPATTIDTINTAFTNCASDPSSTNTACTATNKAVLVQAFVEIYGLDASLGVGRANTAILATTYVSNARRVLPAADGSVMLEDTNGFDAAAATAMWAPSTAVTFTAATDMATWSAGYVAPTTTTTTSSSSTTTKNAKVVIGTILSAIFAIAFLN